MWLQAVRIGAPAAAGRLSLLNFLTTATYDLRLKEELA